MDTPKTLDDVEKILKRVRTAKELFGPEPEKMHHVLLFITHPDRNPGDDKADSLFKEINRFWNSLSTPPAVIKSKKRSYTLLKILKAGDVADIHLGEGIGPDGVTHEYLLKISRIVHGDKLLDNEQKIVKELLTKAGDTTYRKYFPTLVESFPATDKIQKRVNVFLHEGKSHTAEDLHAKVPVLDSRHLAWMFKRLLIAIGFAHKTGYIHGAVLPSHVLFKEIVDSSPPELDHGAMLTSWGHAIKFGDTVKTISIKYKEWYPPEVLAKKPATAGTDIYLAAKIMFYLAGVDPNGKFTIPAKQIPIPMQRFFQSCLLPGAKMRPDNAWALHDEFDDLLKTLYGKPKFHHLYTPE